MEIREVACDVCLRIREEFPREFLASDPAGFATMAAGCPVKQVYRFLGYELDPVRRVISRGGDLLPMAPKVVDTLRVLVEHAGEVVDKDTLMHAVWPDTSVVESSLTRNISLLRKILVQDGSSQVVIQTVSKRGYRFVPPVEVVAEMRHPDGAAALPPAAAIAAGWTRRQTLTFTGAALACAAVALMMGAIATAPGS